MADQKIIWHSISVEAALKNLKTTRKGITQKQADERLQKFGLNRLPEEKPVSKFKILLDQLKSPLIYILVIAGFITLILQDWTDSVVIFAAVFLNSIIGFLQENKTSQILSKLRKVVREKAIVIRNGHEKEIRQTHLTIGDVIVLQPGDKVPADARLIESFGLKVNESALTGEWLAVDKTIKKLSQGLSLADRKNMLYMGTVIESGRAKAVVVGTGIKTEIGKIAKSLQVVEEEKTPYQKKIAKFSKIIAIAVGLISIAIFIGGIITGRDILEMFTTSVAVAVAAIPEGLPVAITVIMALGMERILRKKGLVKKLVAAEVLGSTSIICTDKTGTMTQAKMQVAELITGSKKNGDKLKKLTSKVALSCTEAFIENIQDPANKWIVRGRPTEAALVVFASQSGMKRDGLEKKEPRKDILPFEPQYKYSASLNKISGSQDILYILGAPELILKKSNYYETNKETKKMTDKKREELKKKFEKLNSQGLRLVATGYKKISNRSLGEDLREQSEIGDLSEEEKRNLYEKHLKDMVFVSFIVIKDPLRSEVKKAIKTVRQAGMKPIIITGDHKLTAQAIAKEVGIPAESKNIIEGEEFEKMSDREFKKRLRDITIYARMEPRHKLRIVQAWQEKGEVVAMTGDGVNDAPALKKANIGMALGSGTDVAKEASDLVLLTDNFSIIVTAIKEGRTIIDNIRKVITFLFADGFTEIILIGGSLLAGLPLPLLPAQLLWVNLIEDSLPAVSLGFEKPEKGVMKRHPEDLDSSLLTKEIKFLIFVIGIVTSIILFGLFIWLFKKSLDIAEIRTVIFAGLAIDSIFYVFSCKDLKKNIWEIKLFSNKFLVLSWVFSVAMLLIAVYVPIFQTILKTVPMNLFDWGLVFVIGLINLFFIEITKLFYKKEL